MKLSAELLRSYFHDWIDTDMVDISIELLDWGCTFSGFRGLENCGKKGFLKWEDSPLECTHGWDHIHSKVNTKWTSNWPPKRL